VTLTRRQLYAAGETFGECATRRKPGGGYVCGGGDSSSSQATTNNDKRVAVQDGIGISGDRNSITTTNVITDGGIVSRGLQTVDYTTKRAFDSIDTSNALVGDGYNRLIAASEKMFDAGQSLIGQTQDRVADAWLNASTDGKGTIDNKTIVMLTVAAGAVAVAVAFAGAKK
jgi:hypothetical protein